MPRRSFWYWLLPCLLALGLYAITIPGTFVYDDRFAAQLDPRLRDPRLWVGYLRQGYFPDGADNIWRPLVSLTFAVEAWVHGDRAWVYHLVNVLLHAIVSGMVAVLGARLAGRPGPLSPGVPGEGERGDLVFSRRVGLVAGLLFAALPIHVEAVAGIVGRAEEMASIGILAALLLFIDRPLTIRRALGINGWFLFAAFSKEQGLLVPIMLLIWAGSLSRYSGGGFGWGFGIWDFKSGISNSKPPPRPSPGVPGEGERRRAALWLTFLLAGTLAAYISYRNSILPWYWERGFLDVALNPLIASKGADRWLIPISILGRYAALIVAPVRMSIDYGMSVFTSRFHRDAYFYLGPLVIAVGGALSAFAWVRRWRAGLFCLACLALVYFMVSNIVIIGTIFAERLMYVPSIFVCILAAMGLSRLPAKVLWPTIIVLLSLASLRTVTYAYQWNDRMRLYTYSRVSQPQCGQIYLLIALEYTDAGDAPAADRMLTEARAVAPDSWQVWMRSARAKMALGQYEEAQRFAQQAFHLRPGEPTVMGTLEKINAEFTRRAATQKSDTP